MDFDPDDKGSFAVGFGSYKSEHAAALGASK
ncbi:YadA-like family protein [Megasphaera sp.]|nr:YadA-like family protein [Megasphaera sp.]MBS7222530.1 YadA-like family protein [Megasphaera sp.]MCH3931164.1 YadA C-terminal domain-containing protein [Megasphaera sp.]